jgi:hypothetical protein
MSEELPLQITLSANDWWWIVAYIEDQLPPIAGWPLRWETSITLTDIIAFSGYRTGTRDAVLHIVLTYIRKNRFTGLGILQVAHDDGCKAMTSGRDKDCCPPCLPDFYLVEPFAVSPAEAKAVLN